MRSDTGMANKQADVDLRFGVTASIENFGLAWNERALVPPGIPVQANT
jgi:hypothetical protein